MGYTRIGTACDGLLPTGKKSADFSRTAPFLPVDGTLFAGGR